MRKYPLIAQEDKEWVPIIPIPKGVVFPDLFTHKYLRFMNDYLTFISYFSYVNEKNQIIGYVVQFKDENNDISYLRTLTYCKNRLGELSWFYRSFDFYPLYNLYELLAYPSKKVLLVENEESAILAKDFFPDHVVISWYKGMTSDYTKVDWNILRGRDITIWPNADSLGIKLTFQLKDFLPQFKIKSLRSVVPQFSKATIPYGWDFSDPLPPEWQNLDLNLILDNSIVLYYTEDYLEMINPDPSL